MAAGRRVDCILTHGDNDYTLQSYVTEDILHILHKNSLCT